MGLGLCCAIGVLVISYRLHSLMGVIDLIVIFFFPYFSFRCIVTDGVCGMVFCGQGTCQKSNTSALGFECECNPGWKRIQIGPVSFPACLIPNCKLLFLSFCYT